MLFCLTLRVAAQAQFTDSAFVVQDNPYGTRAIFHDLDQDGDQDVLLPGRCPGVYTIELTHTGSGSKTVRRIVAE